MNTEKYSIKKSVGLPKNIGYHWNMIAHLTAAGTSVSGHKLTSINFKFREDDVLIIVKKDTPKAAMVAFYDAEDIEHALWGMAVLFSKNSVKWRVDEWEMRRREK